MNTNRRTLALIGGAIASVAFVGGAVAMTGGDTDSVEVVSVAAATDETTTTTETPSIEFPNPATGGAAGALSVAGDEALEVDEPVVDPEPVPTTAPPAPPTTVAPAPPTTEAPPVPTTEPAADSILAVRCQTAIDTASDELLASIDPTYHRDIGAWNVILPICKQLPGYPWGL
ncbi:MAG: hypothetical protein ACXIVQ_12290 [Acidimicrobiales bacterium]